MNSFSLTCTLINLSSCLGSAKRTKTFAVFGFKGNSLTVGLKQYYFYDSPAYINADLDVIILQLKPDYGLPNGWTLLRERPSPYQKITFVGHPNGEPQKMALECPMLSPDHRIVMESYDYFHRQNAQGGFDGVRDPCSVLVQSGIGNGAAGSPGIVPTENTAVACMLTTGYPTFRSHIAPQDLNHTFEKAVAMHSLYKYLKNDNPRLCFSIF